MNQKKLDELDKLVQSHGNKLNDLFCFLKTNKGLNESIQNNTYKRALAQHTELDEKPKCISLLYEISRQQPFGKLDKLKGIFSYLHNKTNEGNFDSLEHFYKTISDAPKVKILRSDQSGKGFLELIFLNLEAVGGFGEKTAALLTKSIYDIQTRNLGIEIWKEWRTFENDKIFLPVDAVIKHIFTAHFGLANPDFNSINYIITKFPDEMDSKTDRLECISIWDDLWFWGFITQQTTDDVRNTVWNEAKYWTLETLPETDREGHSTSTENKAKEFIDLLKSA